MKTKVLKPTPVNLRRMAAHLRRGGIVAVPTETVYGLAANALDAAACRRIFRAKKRPSFDPLIVHVLNPAEAKKLAVWNEAAETLASRFWPGPLTIVLPKQTVVPGIVTSGLESVALRCPDHPVMRRLLTLAGLPLAAPSANPFGAVSPTSADHVVAGLGNRIPFVLDGGVCEIGVESTIVDLRDPRRPVVLRPGKIGPAELSRLLRRQRVRRVAGAKSTAPDAPGMLARHYSPKVRLILVSAGKMHSASRRIGDREAVIFYRRPKRRRSNEDHRVRWLTESNATDAARALYRVLREMDQPGFRQVKVELAPRAAGAIGEAINDRLRRAAGRG